MINNNLFSLSANPSRVHIRDKNAVQKTLSLSKAEKFLKLKWLEWDINYAKVIYPSENFVDLASYNVSIVEKLLVRYMDPRCGWGLFAKDHITKGTIICVFTGIIKLENEIKSKDGESVFISGMTSDDRYLIIDGTDCGNITKFLQHLPKQDQVTKYRFDSDINPLEIATENVTLAIISALSGLQTAIYIATEDIPPNTIIGCTYRESFWEGRKPLFFRKDGTILSAAIA
jgi:hypothetical protein